MTHKEVYKAALITPDMPILDGDSIDLIASAVTDEQALVVMTRVSRQWKQIADKNAHWYRIAILRFPRLAEIALRLDANLDKSGAKAAFMNQYQMEKSQRSHTFHRWTTSYSQLRYFSMAHWFTQLRGHGQLSSSSGTGSTMKKRLNVSHPTVVEFWDPYRNDSQM